MRTLRKGCLVLLAAAGLLSGCRKFLDRPPYNNVSVDDIFKDYEGARTTVVGLYNQLRSTNYYLVNFYLYPEAAGGNIKYTRTTGLVQFNSYAFLRDEQTNNDLKGFYEQAYAVVYGANNILQNIDRAADASALQKARMRAEAYCIRALAHFDLVRTFAQPYGFSPDAGHPGVVLRTQNSSVLTLAGERATVKQVYDRVVADLDSAIYLYNNSVSIYPTGDARTFLSADAAKALKSRVSLYRDDYATAISAATELIASNKYPLVANNQYVKSWSGRTISSESIFELTIPVSGTSGGLGAYFNPVPNSTTFQLGTSNDLLSLYAAGDVRGPGSLFSTVTVNGTQYSITRKYQGTADSINNIKIFRSSELYLNRAEAYARSNNLPAALADLNTIRKRALPAAANFTSTSQQAVVDEILQERRRELAFEGHLFFDIARAKKDLVRVDNTAQVKSFTWPNAFYAYPIPVYQ